MHGSSHKGKVFLGKRLLILPVLISVKQHVDGMAICVVASVCTTLLCLLIQRLFMHLFL